MKIAIASQNWKTVTAHAGKTRRFIVFEAFPGQPPHELERLELPREMTIHEYHGDAPHPLYDMDTIIAASAGDGFIRRLGSKGVKVATTSETHPLAAIAGLLDGTLPPAPPHDHHHH